MKTYKAPKPLHHAKDYVRTPGEPSPTAQPKEKIPRTRPEHFRDACQIARQ